MLKVLPMVLIFLTIQNYLSWAEIIPSVPIQSVPTLLNKTQNGDDITRKQAILELSSIGEPVLPAIIESVKNGNRYAYHVLIKIGAPSVPHIIPLLSHENWRIRREACWYLGWIGPQAHEAVPDLVKCLKDVNASVRSACLDAFEDIGTVPVSEIIGLLNDPDIRVQKTAVDVLGKGGNAAVDAIPALIKLIGTKADEEDIFGFCGLAGPPVPMSRVMTTLANIGPLALPHLVELTKSNEPWIRRDAVRAISRISDLSVQHVLKLVAAYKDTNCEVRYYVLDGLRRIGKHPELVIPVLIEALNDSDTGVQMEAAYAASGFGPSAAPVVPQLIKILRDPTSQKKHHWLSGNAAHALGTIGDPAVDPLLEALIDDDPIIRGLAMDAIASMIKAGHKPSARKAIPLLVKMQTFKNMEIREHAARLLTQLREN